MTARPPVTEGLLKSSASLSKLNALFEPLSYRARIAKLYELFRQEDILVTSSFGTRSVFLLHLISELRPQQPVHFIDTTYHFPETLSYKTELTERFGLNVIDIRPSPEENLLTYEEQWWKDHPRMCCSVNKVVPLQAVEARHRVWMSGLMAFQTEFRAKLPIFEQRGDIIKFHPLIDIEEGEFLYQTGFHKLPAHPLEALGYGSVGCTHCTEKGKGRSGRWQATKQTECGLHTHFFRKHEK